jgi:hypothetical protein
MLKRKQMAERPELSAIHNRQRKNYRELPQGGTASTGDQKIIATTGRCWMSQWQVVAIEMASAEFQQSARIRS